MCLMYCCSDTGKWKKCCTGTLVIATSKVTKIKSKVTCKVCKAYITPG